MAPSIYAFLHFGIDNNGESIIKFYFNSEHPKFDTAKTKYGKKQYGKGGYEKKC